MFVCEPSSRASTDAEHVRHADAGWSLRQIAVRARRSIIVGERVGSRYTRGTRGDQVAFAARSPAGRKSFVKDTKRAAVGVAAPSRSGFQQASDSGPTTLVSSVLCRATFGRAAELHRRSVGRRQRRRQLRRAGSSTSSSISSCMCRLWPDRSGPCSTSTTSRRQAFERQLVGGAGLGRSSALPKRSKLRGRLRELPPAAYRTGAVPRGASQPKHARRDAGPARE